MIDDYLTHARWFAGKGRAVRSVTTERLATVAPRAGTSEPDPQIRVELARVDYVDGDVEHYLVPLAVYPSPEGRLSHALVEVLEDGSHAYDALHDRAAMGRFLEAFVAAGPEGTVVDTLRLQRLPGHDLDATAHSTLFSGEQSNSSVMFGDDSLFKLFRKITPGANPDIEIHRALTAAGSDHVAALYGWVRAEHGGATYDLGMLQQFLRTASDGWDLARASVRSLLSDWEGADDAGGDFGGEAERLGLACREVHASLAEVFPTSTLDAAEVAARMQERLEIAARDVPELEPHVGRVGAVLDAVRGLGEVPVQRVHGDLHLGQTLRTVRGWKLVDFEGEPAKPLAERVLPDSPWRDVAGMLRSFDYAARSVARDFPEPEAESAVRAAAWAERNRERFLAGYAESMGSTDRLLMAAYEADKAVYEVVYEARNRPAWIDIPLAALERIGGPS